MILNSFSKNQGKIADQMLKAPVAADLPRGKSEWRRGNAIRQWRCDPQAEPRSGTDNLASSFWELSHF
ncbi:MAG: hypothetical protein ABJZ69_08095 [Hyphomicrobiales bacterium]